jgi:hypothetical protein
VDLTQLDFPLVAKVIDYPKNQDQARNDIKRHLIIDTPLDLEEILNTQAGHQKVHGSPQKGQKGGLIGKYGALKGGWMAFKRLMRCHPWGGHGHDPVP